MNLTLTHVLAAISGFLILLSFANFLIIRFPRFAAWLERLVDGG
jgi:hypothetical protein